MKSVKTKGVLWKYRNWIKSPASQNIVLLARDINGDVNSFINKKLMRKTKKNISLLYRRGITQQMTPRRLKCFNAFFCISLLKRSTLSWCVVQLTPVIKNGLESLNLSDLFKSCKPTQLHSRIFKEITVLIRNPLAAHGRGWNSKHLWWQIFWQSFKKGW